jgi:hypothetical protein
MIRKEIHVKALEVMKPPFTGGCLCAELSYICEAAPVWSVNCHCHACQKLSGAPYVSAFSVPAQSFRMTGTTLTFERLSEAGHVVQTRHCATCGTRVTAQSAGARHLMNVFAATLTDPSTFTPVSNVYLSEIAPWIEPPNARFNFPKMPMA